MSASTAPIKVLQFTDTHLFANAGGELCGMNTAQSLAAVLAAAKSDEVPVDFVLATGDLSQDHTPQSYERLRDALSSMEAPVYCLPGNHDFPELMSKVLSRPPVQAARRVEEGNWQVILLDSVIVGKDAGRLAPSELDYLKECLADHPGLHTLVTLHHHPVSVGAPWMDTMMLENAGDFMRTIKAAKNVKGILYGHVHQEYFESRDGLMLMATPSTCVQFTPRSVEFGIDTAAPGYRWLRLLPDGKIESGVKRLKNYSGRPDMKSKGY